MEVAYNQMKGHLRELKFMTMYLSFLKWTF